jgi:hypothetical protein
MAKIEIAGKKQILLAAFLQLASVAQNRNTALFTDEMSKQTPQHFRNPLPLQRKRAHTPPQYNL